MNNSFDDVYEDFVEEFMDRINLIPLTSQTRERDIRHSSDTLDEALRLNQLIANRVHYLRTRLQLESVDTVTNPIYDMIQNIHNWSSLSNSLFDVFFTDFSDAIFENQLQQQQFEDEKVTLTLDQFQKLKTRVADVTDKEKECNICIETFSEGDNLVTLPCQHYFHKECAEKWLTTEKVTCPVCRTDTRADSNVTQSQKK